MGFLQKLVGYGIFVGGFFPLCVASSAATMPEESGHLIRRPEIVAGVKNQAMDFMTSAPGAYYDGTVVYFINAPNPFLHGPEASVSFWFNQKEGPTDQDMLLALKSSRDGVVSDCDRIISGDHFEIWLTASKPENKAKLLATGNIAGRGFKLCTPTGFDPHSWHHVVFLWQNGSLALYLDGKLAGKMENRDVRNNEFGLAKYFCIANDLYDFTHGFHGAMDEIMVFGRTLTPDEITALYQGKDFSADDSLRFYMPCDHRPTAFIKRENFQTLTEKMVVFRAGLGKWHYVPSGTPIPMSLTLPAGTPENFEVEVSIAAENGTRPVVFHDTGTIGAKADAPNRITFDTSIEKCGMYSLDMSVKNSRGEIVFSKRTEFGVTVNLPETRDIPSSSPCGTGKLDELEALGCKWIRFYSNSSWGWSSLEPEKNQFYWEYLDNSVKEATAAGGEIMFCICSTPAWAAQPSDRLKKQLAHLNDDKIQRRLPWLPPEHLEDFENFLRHLFRRYKGKIAAYQLWNEPNSTPPFEANAYVAMLKAARTVLKEEDPNALLVGGSGCPGYTIWTEKIVNCGAAPYLDTLSIHDYCYSDPVSWYYQGNFGSAEKLVADKLGHSIPVWNDETGTVMFNIDKDEFIKRYGGITTHVVGVLGTYRELSTRWDIQCALITVMQGGKNKFFWGGTNRAQVSEKGIAFAALSKVLSFESSTRPIVTGNDSSLGVLIKDQKGKCTAALFSNGHCTSVFPCPKTSVEGMDMYGNPVDFKTRGGLLTLELTGDVVYLFDVPENFNAVNVISADIPQNSQAGQPFSCPVKITNPYSVPEIFTLTVEMPDGWGSDISSKKCTVPANSAVVETITVKPSDKTGNAALNLVVVDSSGNRFPLAKTVYNVALLRLREIPEMKQITDEEAWKNIEIIGRLDSEQQVAAGKVNPMFPDLPHWQGVKDLSAIVRGGWNKDGVFLQIDVTDNQLYPGEKDRPWNRDAVELFVDFYTSQNGKPRQGRLHTEQLVIVPPQTDNFEPCFVKYCDGGDFGKGEFYGRKTPDGYMIVGNVKHGTPTPGWEIGLDVLVDDCDDPNGENTRKTVMVLHGDQYAYLDLRKWGRYLLVLSPKARIDVDSGKTGPKIKFLEGSSGYFAENPAWMKEQKEQYLYTIVPAGEQYEKHRFSFVSDRDGAVFLQFMGNWSKKVSDMPFIDYSDVVVKGAVSAPDFPATFTAHSSRRVVRKLMVKGGQPVDVFFSAKVGQAPAETGR